MKWNIKQEILPIAVLVILVVLSLYFYSLLPDPMPTHFGGNGTPNGYMGKLSFFLIFGGIVLGLYLLLTFIPRIDPFWKAISPKYGLFLVFRDICMLFFAYIFVLALIAARRGSMPVEALNIGFGLMFILIGNWLPKVPRNFFFGIRTPWTLASEVVWKRSHIVGGWMFVAGGIILIILALAGVKAEIVLPVVLAPLVIVSGIIYPLFLYRRLQKEGKLNAPEL
jgi:uncharacterized membrane protein